MRWLEPVANLLFCNAIIINQWTRCWSFVLWVYYHKPILSTYNGLWWTSGETYCVIQELGIRIEPYTRNAHVFAVCVRVHWPTVRLRRPSIKTPLVNSPTTDTHTYTPRLYIKSKYITVVRCSENVKPWYRKLNVTHRTN